MYPTTRLNLTQQARTSLIQQRLQIEMNTILHTAKGNSVSSNMITKLDKKGQQSRHQDIK